MIRPNKKHLNKKAIGNNAIHCSIFDTIFDIILPLLPGHPILKSRLFASALNRALKNANSKIIFLEALSLSLSLKAARRIVLECRQFKNRSPTS